MATLILEHRTARPLSRRARRMARKRFVKTHKRADPPAGHAAAKVKVEPATALTIRQRVLLRKAVEPLFNAGVVRIAYLGLRFLELYALHWTAQQLRCDEQAFAGVHDWWSALHYQQRRLLIEMSRNVM